MKRFIFIALALTLALAMVWVPSVAAEPNYPPEGNYPVEIIKTIPAGGPIETFTFWGYRDMNNNGAFDEGVDYDLGTVEIEGAGSGVLYSPYLGICVVCEELIEGSAYKPQPCQSVQADCVPVVFENELEDTGQIRILKVDEDGDLITVLPGATYEISPNPKTCELPALTVVDEGENDEALGQPGVVMVTECQVCCECWVTETVAPEGYTLITTPQKAHVQEPGQTVELTFANEELDAVLAILKLDESGNIIDVLGACFELTPDPRTCEGSLIFCDNDANDLEPQNGVLVLGEIQVCCPFTVSEIVAPPGYELDPTPHPAHATVPGEIITITFTNTKCELTIYKVDESGEPLAGACFTITPDPRTGEGYLELCDNDANDECSADGVLCLSELLCGLECTVEETTVPDGYEGAALQTVVIGETLALTFENTRTPPSCGTVCAAQTAPGEFLFSDRQDNWFTWIFYDIGWGTEASPYEYPIYTGATTLCGTLYVYDDGTHIFVNYVLTDTDCALGGLSEYHLQVDESFDALYGALVKGKNPVPGKAEYSGSFDPMVPSTGWIEAVDDDISGWTTAYIFAHGVGCYYCS